MAKMYYEMFISSGPYIFFIQKIIDRQVEINSCLLYTSRCV